jgi:hypothetical protein
MTNFAILKNNRVTNIAVADSIEILGALLPDAELVVEITDKTGAGHVGAEYRNNKFVPFRQFASWTWDEKKWAWVAPKPYPADGKMYDWDEKSLSWIKLDVKAISPEPVA